MPMPMLYWFICFFKSCFTFALRFWNQFCVLLADALRVRGYAVTHVDLIQRHVEIFRKAFLRAGAGLMLDHEMRLEYVVLLFCEAGLNVGTAILRQLLRRASRLLGRLWRGTLRASVAAVSKGLHRTTF
jgi:hypothetical protein